MGHGHQRPKEGLSFPTIGEGAGKGLIYFQHIQIQSLQLRQSGVAGTKVVNRHADAHFLDRL